MALNNLISTFVGVLLLSSSCFAQDHDANFIFGYYGGGGVSWLGGSKLTFKEDSLEIQRFDMPNDMSNSTCSYSDFEGNFRFYSNGCAVYNKRYNLMENGDGLVEGFWADVYCDIAGYVISQGMVALPFPNKEDSLVVLLYLELEGNFVGRIKKSIIDIKANNGLGKVLEKATVILEDTLTFGQLSAVRHANGRDWWILIAEYESNRFYSFLLDPNGLAGPFEQRIGAAWDEFEEHGAALFSPDGTKYARQNHRNGLDLFDFDRASGTLSSYKKYDFGFSFDSVTVGGLSFSPNSEMLYISFGTYLYSLNTSINADFQPEFIDRIDETGDTTGTNGSPFSFTYYFYSQQLAPDGKIYIASNNGSTYLHQIHRPNRMGEACNFTQHSLKIPTYNAFSMPYFPNYRLGPIDGSDADTIGIDNHPVAKFRHERDSTSRTIHFFDLSYYAPDTWSWDFGDGYFSSFQEPIHTFDNPGTYRVCLTVSNENSKDTKCKKIYLGERAEKDRINFILFPNPSNGPITIEPIDIVGGAPLVLTLFSIDGKLVFDEIIGNIGQSNVVELPPHFKGIYYYLLTSNDKELQYGKLVRY